MKTWTLNAATGLVAILASASLSAEKDEETVLWTEFFMPSCQKLEGFAERSRRPYEQWREKHRDTIALRTEVHRVRSASSIPRLAVNPVTAIHTGLTGNV